jgi:hypothetical protein
MKKKLTRIMGVVLSAILLTTLVIGLVAVPASAATLRFSAQATPGTTALTGNTVVAGSDTNMVMASPDGSTVYAVDNTGPRIFRSIDGGANWIASAPLAGPVVAMVVSPGFATDNTVIIATATAVYKSTNGGATFVQMSAALAGTLVYTSLAISPTYGTDGLLLAGVADTADGAYGDCMVFGRPLTFGWVSAGAAALGQDVTAVAFSPNFPLDFTIMALGSHEVATTGTQLNFAVNFAAWNAAFGPATINAASEVGDATVAANAITSGQLALPEDFNASIPTLRRAYVTTITSAPYAVDDVFRVTGAAVASVGYAVGTGTAAYSIAYSGTVTTGTLFGGDVASPNVWRCANPAAAIGNVWLPNAKAPTGGTMAYVSLDAAFATNSRVYSGTTGAAADESAANFSDDGGSTFYQTGIIDTIIAGIVDLLNIDATTMYMVTTDGGAGPESVWKTTNGGADWWRMLAFVTTANLGIIHATPTYASDMGLVFGDVGGTVLQRSANAGASWIPFAVPAPATIGAIIVESPTNIYVGQAAAGTVLRTANAGWTWTPAALAGALGVFDMKMNANGDILVGTTNGMVMRSTNGGISFAAMGAAIGAGNVVVAFDANYGTNSTVYAGNTAATGVFRFTGTVWANIDPGALTTGIGNIVVASDGTLYASDVGLNVGVFRAINPTAAVAAAVVSELLGAADGLTAGATLGWMNLVEGSNQLFVINTALANAVLTYTDTIMSTTSPVMTAPRNKAEVTSFAAVLLSWDAVAGATAYQVRVDTRPDFLAGTVALPGGGVVGAPITSLNVTAAMGLAAGTTYYWQVRVWTPVIGAWGGDLFGAPFEFSTALGPPPPAPGLTSPLPGATSVPQMPIFQWTAMGGATAYELKLADNPEFDGAITPGGYAGLPGTAWTPDTELEYGKTYFWKVRALSATGDSPWSVTGSFTVMTEPVPPPDEPDIILNPIVIPPDPVGPAETPAWVWAVIGIGAVLVIALIILIIRTRRVP